ncbi:Membrane-associated phospholipid phosphatase [Natronoarchaeum philippinense]|uniref:Membrane-associated phospholipid phosphatase n=1 Tax=Natronoarchaeum philippinense TaxID=558529 RepID=A0A285NTI8_NATPI|nr:phosphatase PAP2 family protein [Natronoarchaeum philippinense]SNZ12804.1 Membrane-associated phospholipid phosphatase [Natronoarchaeum philippinense]
MALLDALIVTVLAVAAGLAVTATLCIEVEQLRRTANDIRNRLFDVAPYLAVTAVFFLGKRATHGKTLQISKSLDWNITDEIYAIEGLFVAHLQDFTPNATYDFFSTMYMFGFPFLLVFPLLAYFLLPSGRYLKELLMAYLLNYFIGTLCYTLFIAYGPRVWVSDAVAEPMYEIYPSTQDLTAAVSANTNVFPSLHTSLAVAAALLAWRSREEYPRWFKIATFVATCVVLSTMILGIHWLIDVIAGLVLAVVSVWGAVRIVDWGERRRSSSRGGVDGAAAGTDD